MAPSVEQIIKQHRKAAAQLRKENRNPRKAREFLIRAGIAEPTRTGGIRLVKQLRSD